MTIEKVIIIIPTFNEALVIEDTLHQVFQETATIASKEIQVLVFDSNSTDQTQTIVTRLQATYSNLHLKNENQKSGLGSAYRQAMQIALDELSADIVIEFDADLSHQPKYIAPMLEKMNKYDVVMGSRYVQGGSIPKDWGWHRKLLSRVGNWVARLILTPKYSDFTSGFRATRKQVLIRALPQQFLSNGYAYKIQLLWSFHKNKDRVCEYPIVFVDRKKGQSKLPANSILESLRVLFILRIRELKQYFTMCLVGISGMVVQFTVYNILRQNMSPFNAAQLAVIAAIINNFIFNNRFTFKNNIFHQPVQKLKSFVLFIGYSMLMVSFQSHWLQLGIKYIGSGYIKENLVMIAAILTGSYINYLTYSRLVWPEKKLTEPLQEF